MNSPAYRQDAKRPLIESLSALAGLAGGALLAGIAMLSVTSIALRSLGFQPIQGDFELVQVGMAVCIALLLPWCQLQGGNITVDFFTAHVRRKIQKKLDAIGALLFALVMALVAWRTGAGAVVIKANGETTMILGFPLWIGYAAMTPGLALTAVAALYNAMSAWQESRGE